MTDTEQRKKPPPITVTVDGDANITVDGKPVSNESVLKAVDEARAKRNSEKS